MMWDVRIACVSVALGIAVLQAPEAKAEDFYAGKTLTILNSGDAGGGFDTYTRILAKHLGKYIPGNPIIVIKGIPGGGGLRAAQQLYAVAPKDGTTIGNLRSSNILDSILGIRGTEVSMSEYNWLGSMGSDTDICSFWHTAGVKTLDDLRQKEIVVGASGKGAQNYSFPNAMNQILGTKMKIILGYKGAADRLLALERGELQGNCGIYASSIASLNMPLIESGKLVPVVQSGLSPSPSFPNVPLTQSYATNDRDRKLLTALFAQMEIARVFAAPPGLPKDKVAILRNAFAAALADPELLAETRQLGSEPKLVSGERVDEIVREMNDLPQDLKDTLKGLVGE
jgi:tripartite-type tricarboxylate transporter receptor subunit TctC